MRTFFAFTLTLLLSILTVAFGSENASLQVCLVSGSEEYHSDASLEQFKQFMESRYNAECSLIKAIGFEQLPGVEALDRCDVALFFTRRLTITGDELDHVKKYCESGRPIVALRTASHGFQNWLDFDKLVLGGNYQGHLGDGPTQKVSIEESAKNHPIFKDIPNLFSRYSLYKTAPLATDATLLMTASVPGKDPQPSAWTRTVKGARVFYTALGGPEDFENQSFCKMIANALFWTANKKMECKVLPPPPSRTKPAGNLHLPLRTRVETFKGSNQWEEVFVEKEFPIAETALLICDMWDKHWCDGASERVDAMVPRMNAVVKTARDKGIQIVHAPSETMGFYADTPQRRRMQLAPAAAMPKLLDLPDPPLPIDDSDGGCTSAEKPWYQAWTRQHAGIEIGEFDGISDNGTEIYNFYQQQGIKTILIMGVHTNMCVLGRSFAIKNMIRLGKQIILVRDLTDTMYDPKDPPYVEHDKGTELVVHYIEKYWCPTILSTELTAGIQ